MPESYQTQDKIAKLQKDVQELKEHMEDDWHERRDVYIGRVEKALRKDRMGALLYLEIDGTRSMVEIETDLRKAHRPIPQRTLWDARTRLLKKGLIRKIDAKGKSPVFAKKPWAKALDVDDYVREEILGQ